MNHIKSLDAIRAIAVAFVIISHWLPSSHILNSIPNGAIGVDIFFVLSGFLITRILFVNRDSFPNSKGFVLKNFFVRRTLRIFPVYYLTVLLLLLFSKYTGVDVKSAFPYLVTYTTNIYFFDTGKWYGMISHLWSLAVEEQFYLIWPWLILFVKRQYSIYVIVLFIMTGIASQFYLHDAQMSTLLTFTCFDAFGLGALLAWFMVYKPEKLRTFFIWSCWSAFAALILVIASSFYRNWSYFPLRTVISIFALWVITYLVTTNNNQLYFRFILENRILVFLGKISYGIYLFHNIIPSTVNAKVINIYLNPLLPDLIFKKHWGELYFVENFILVVLISWLSFRFIEMPFLKFKSLFEYKKDEVVQ